jgi:hypothetical protein
MIFAQVVETSHLNISVYNDAGVPRDVLARSEERAAMIFSHAGFELSWTNHGYRFSDHGSKFKEISEPGDLVMRIIPRAATSTNNAVFGVSFLGPDGTGRYSDVFWTKVKELHTNYNVDITGVLGSVMAHEIGHLLLGSQAHAVSGIMRARWESHELHQIAMGTLLFLPWQEQRMRIRVTELAARTSRPGLAHRASAQIY